MALENVASNFNLLAKLQELLWNREEFLIVTNNKRIGTSRDFSTENVPNKSLIILQRNINMYGAKVRTSFMIG